MGLLTGKWRRGQQPEGPSRLKDGTGQEMRVPDWERLYAVVDALEEAAGRHGATIPQVALAWTLTRPGVHNTSVAARNLEQLEDLLGCADLQLTAEDLSTIDHAGRPGIIYPHWHQADMASERLSPADEDIIGTIGDQVAEQFGVRS